MAMTCEQFREALHRALDGESVGVASRAHAALCDECRRYEHQMRALMSALDDVRSDSKWEAPAPEAAIARRFPAWKRVAWAALGAAAGVALLLGVRHVWLAHSGASQRWDGHGIVADGLSGDGIDVIRAPDPLESGTSSPVATGAGVVAQANGHAPRDGDDSSSMTGAAPLVPGQAYCIAPDLTLEGESARRYMAVTEVCPAREGVTVVWLCDAPTEDGATGDPTDRG